MREGRLRGLARSAAAVAGASAAWGLYESQWLDGVVLDVPVPDLPPELDGYTILHLSDFHLGSLSLNHVALRKAVEWAEARDPDLVAITGDLLSRDRGEADLDSAVSRLRARDGVLAVLGNHDVAVTRDPFSGATELVELDGAMLLKDDTVTFEARGARVQVVGVDPRTYMSRKARPERMIDRSAGLRVLLCHFPKVLNRIELGSFHLVLAGHVHGGQICLPYPGGKITFGELRPQYRDGVFRLGGSTLVVSRGTGTAFVPFRFFARPEVALLVLRRAG